MAGYWLRHEAFVAAYVCHYEIRQAASPGERRFLREDLESESWQWLGETLCVDRSVGRVVIDGAANQGLSVGWWAAYQKPSEAPRTRMMETKAHSGQYSL